MVDAGALDHMGQMVDKLYMDEEKGDGAASGGSSTGGSRGTG